MPYDPPRRGYAYIDGELPKRSKRPGTTRTAQVLPRKNYDTAELARQARRQAREEARKRSRTTNSATPDEEEDDDEDIDGNGDVWPPQVVTRSAIRYNVPPEGVYPEGEYQIGNQRFHVQYHYAKVPPRAHAKPRLPPAPQQQTYADEAYEGETERPLTRRRRGLHLHWLAILGIGMVFMLALVVIGNAVSTWWTIHQDDSTYGRPRTFQIDAVVGHNDSAENPSHFEAINLHRHIIVIELPGGDSSKARIYNITTLFGNGQELTPVTLSFKDVNNDGLLDMDWLVLTGNKKIRNLCQKHRYRIRKSLSKMCISSIFSLSGKKKRTNRILLTAPSQRQNQIPLFPTHLPYSLLQRNRHETSNQAKTQDFS